MIWRPTTASNRDVLYFFIECSTNFFWINLSACVVLLEYEIELVLTGHCFLWDEKQSNHLIYLPSSQGGPTTAAGKCQVLWILCCTVHMNNCICMGRRGERVFKLLKKCVKASITCQVPCRQPRIVSKDWNLCPEETQHVQNLSLLWRQCDARTKYSQVPFYDQVDIMGYPTEPYYPYPYYLTDALLSLFLLSYWCIVLQRYDINAKMRLRSKVVNSSHQKCSWFDNLGQSGIWTCSYQS